ncbi:hypothetical protein B0H14DRAFT_3046906 [Mycena olivaceomarginata]|nr:hypothetical protein B0H14DRAFT_3046906 [Mycena olivaceomarginata]
MPRSYPVNEDSGNSSEDEDYDSEDDSDSAVKYEIEVLDAEGREVVQRGRRNRIRDGSDVSSSGSGKLATLPSEASAFGLMANLSLKQGRGDPGAKSALDIANVDFFRPNRAAPDPSGSRPLGGGPTIPHILRRGLISPQEVEKLFDIYFQAMNISTSALDPVLHTPQKTLFRSPFLFTVVCALASKFCTERPELYPQAMHFAQMAAGTALIGGQKRVDLVQAYLLMATYPVPSRRWDEDRGWIYLGLAIRMATDLNLHLPSTATPMLNRARTWLHCFNLDRSMGSEYGKAPTIRNNDFIATHAEDWWRSSPYNLPHSDIHICGSCAFMGKIFSDPTHPTMLNKNIDFEAIASETDEELKALAEKWWLLLDQTDMTHPHNQYRCGMLRLAFSYGRLVALSFGFQHAFGKNVTTENPFFMRCMAAASDVVKATVNDLGGGPSQRVYLRHGPIGCFLQPKFAAYLTSERRKEVRALVKSVINLLASPEVSVDDKHGPSLYGRFLKGLLAAPLAKRPRRPTATRNSSSGQGGDSTTSSAASPDSRHSLSPAPTTASLSFNSFAPPLGGSVDPFMPIAAGDADPSVPNFLTPAMNFGDDAMQGLPAVWPEDFSTWMTQLQTELMKPGEPMVYNSY